MSTTAIKWLALVLMLVDHLGEFFPQSVPLWFRWLGRMSVPLFLFCLLEGFAHTRNRKKYFLRIYAIAVGMGALQYDWETLCWYIFFQRHRSA